MSFRLKSLALVAALVTSVATANSSQACDGIWGGGYYGLGVGALYNSLDRYSDYRVPYFAAHPPVYYSYPVPRTYGHSPFAYPPNFRTPEVAGQVAAIQITNPYVEGPAIEVKPAETENQSVSLPKLGPTHQPQTILNPYVSDSVGLVQSEG